jgi:hypothetical protein
VPKDQAPSHRVPIQQALRHKMPSLNAKYGVLSTFGNTLLNTHVFHHKLWGVLRVLNFNFIWQYLIFLFKSLFKCKGHNTLKLVVFEQTDGQTQDFFNLCLFFVF